MSGINLDSLNPFDNGHVLDFSGGGPANAWSSLTGQTKGVGNYVNAPQVSPGVAGIPQAGPTSAGNNYGLTDVWQNLNTELGNLPNQGGNANVGSATANAATIDTSGDQGWAGQQQDLAASLRGTINGTTPSVADLQLQRGNEANTSAALSLLGSQRGGGTNAGLLARNAVDVAAANNAQTNQQLGIQRAQEVQAAQGALGGVLAGARGQTQNLAEAQAQLEQAANLANAGYQQQSGLANQNMTLANAQLYDQELNALLGAQTGIGENNQGVAAQIATNNAQLQAGTNAQNVGIQTGNDQATANFLGKVGQGATAAGALAFSDQNLKSGITGGNPMMDSYLRQLSASGGGSHAGRISAIAPYASPTVSRGGQGAAELGQGVSDVLSAIAKKGKESKGAPDKDGPVEAEDIRPEDDPDFVDNAKLGFGEDIGAPEPKPGIETSKDLEYLGLRDIGYGEDIPGSVPYTPATGFVPGQPIDPSVAAALEQPGDAGARLMALSDKETKKEISAASYERGLRDALSTKPGSGTAPLPLPGTTETLPRPYVEAVRHLMSAESSPAAPASDTNAGALARGWYPVDQPATAYQVPPGWQAAAPAPQQPAPAAAPAPSPAPAAEPSWTDRIASLFSRGAAPPAAPPVYAASDATQKKDKKPVSPSPPPDIYLTRDYSVSDEDEKEGKAALTHEQVGDMLDQLHAYNYRYKDPTMPGAAPGRHTGVMAQDLEKSPLGKEFVYDTPTGKVVNYGQMSGVQLAASAYLNDRLDEHEKMIKALAKKAGKRAA